MYKICFLQKNSLEFSIKIPSSCELNSPVFQKKLLAHKLFGFKAYLQISKTSFVYN